MRRILGNKMVLRPLPKAELSAGGIVLLAHLNDDKQQWQVVALGSKYQGEVKVGDYVLLSGYHGNLHEFEDGSILIGPEQIKSDLLAVWTSPTNAPSASDTASFYEPSQPTHVGK